MERKASSHICPHMKFATDYSDYEESMDDLLEMFNRGNDTLYVDFEWGIADYFGPIEGFPPYEPTYINGLHLLPKGKEPGRYASGLLNAEYFYKPEYIPMVEAIIKGLKMEMKEIKEHEYHRKGTQAEKEDEAAQKLIRKAPKKKPPRKDLRKNRVEMSDDPDLQGVGRGDKGDPDLSRRSQKMAKRVARSYLNLRG
jgi:hypothetical protein